MTGPLPVSSSRKQPSRTSAHLPSGFLAPATPHRSAKHRDVTAVEPNGPFLPTSIRIGHPKSNTPQSLDPRLKQELQNHIVQVKTDAFVRAVLYKGAEKKMEEDADLAASCFATLQASPSPHEGRVRTRSMRGKRLPAFDAPLYQTLLLPTHGRSEADMYNRHVSLLNYVAKFFRDKIKDVDDAWAPAQQPTFPPASPQDVPPLNRVFRDTHSEPRSFSRFLYGQGSLKPDLCLLIQPGDKPEEPKESEGKPKTSGGQPKVVPSGSKPQVVPPEGKPQKSEGKPDIAPHWKDVVVAFELKPDENAITADLIQMAQYADSMMLEQFDRIFVITVLINGTSCRVFHWDAVGAQVTEPFDTRSPLFIQVMGRLATMTPSELGYDTHFSNAGRVQSTEIDNIKTHLTIHLSPVRPFFELDPTSSNGECSGQGHILVVHLKDLQFESEDFLFNRATRVWRAKPVNDPPSEAQHLWSTKDTYIVKQNWADDRRPNEGFFHTKAEQVKVVPPLVGMEERQFTSQFRARFRPEEVLGVLNLVDANEDEADQQIASNPGASDEDADRSSRRSLERVLVRFVFARVGRSLNEAKNSVELLQATKQWINGLIDLDNLGIIHRDISYGNLLLPPESDKNGTGQASIIDYGLAHLSNPNILEQLRPSHSGQDFILQTSQTHDHFTGTLPFVAHELLSKLEEQKKCKHQLHHDIESVFWVLLFICLKEHHESNNRFDGILQGLTSHNIYQVEVAKFYILSPPRYEAFDGVGVNTFPEVEAFLKKFIAIWRKCRGAEAVNLASKVRDLVSRELKKAQANRKKRKTQASGTGKPTTATKKPKHQKKAPYGDD